MTTYEDRTTRAGAVDTVAGLIAVFSIALSAIGAGLGFILELGAYPARTIPVAVVLAIVAGRMSARFERLSRVALFLAAGAWVVGMTVAVLSGNPLV